MPADGVRGDCGDLPLPNPGAGARWAPSWPARKGLAAEQGGQAAGQITGGPFDVDDLVAAGPAGDEDDIPAAYPEGVRDRAQRRLGGLAVDGAGGDRHDQSLPVRSADRGPGGAWFHPHGNAHSWAHAIRPAGLEAPPRPGRDVGSVPGGYSLTTLPGYASRYGAAASVPAASAGRGWLSGWRRVRELGLMRAGACRQMRQARAPRGMVSR
jgi:hypothetical protein